MHGFHFLLQTDGGSGGYAIDEELVRRRIAKCELARRFANVIDRFCYTLATFPRERLR